MLSHSAEYCIPILPLVVICVTMMNHNLLVLFLQSHRYNERSYELKIKSIKFFAIIILYHVTIRHLFQSLIGHMI